MHQISLRHLVPLHDFVTLAIFEDGTLQVTDCKLLRNHHVELMPSLNPEIGAGTAHISTELAQKIETEIGQSDYQKPADGDVVTFEVDADLYERWLLWCQEHNISAEKMIHAYLRFCTEENQAVVGAWFADMQKDEMKAVMEFARKHQYTQGQLEKEFDSVLSSVEGGLSPILIKANNGHEFLLFEWNDYWDRLGWAHKPGERQRIESMIRDSTTRNLEEPN